MVGAAGTMVPLSIDPGGRPITIRIIQKKTENEGGWNVEYDSPDYPSGFLVDDVP